MLVLALACASAPAPSGPRVVSLHDTTTEIVVALGDTDVLVAITEPRFLSDLARAAVEGIPRVPGGQVSAEAILALRPTLVVGTDVVSEQQPSLAPTLEARGAAVRWIDPAGLDGLWTAIDELGDDLGSAREAAAYVASLRAQLPPDRSNDPDPLRVFLYDCCDPPFTAGNRAPVSELLARMGAVNIFADMDQDWVHVSWDSVVARSPEFVVVHDYNWEDQVSSRTKVEHLRSLPFLANVPAVQRGAIVTMPLALALEGPRSLEVVRQLGPALEAAREARP